jgi:hypothetical protein
MREQADLQSDMDVLRRWALGNRHRAAGVWFDNGDDSNASRPVRIGIGVVGDTASTARELRALIAHPRLLDVVPKRFTEFHLRAIQQLITAERMHIRTHPESTVTSTGVDIHANKTSVGIDPYDHSFADELLAAYGQDRVLVEHRPAVVFLTESGPPGGHTPGMPG